MIEEVYWLCCDKQILLQKCLEKKTVKMRLVSVRDYTDAKKDNIQVHRFSNFLAPRPPE